MSDIKARLLRAEEEPEAIYMEDDLHHVCQDAHDHIEALEAENARLREALNPSPERMFVLVDTVLHDMGEPNPPWSKQKLRVLYWSIARAALHPVDRDPRHGEKDSDQGNTQE